MTVWDLIDMTRGVKVGFPVTQNGKKVIVVGYLKHAQVVDPAGRKVRVELFAAEKNYYLPSTTRCQVNTQLNLFDLAEKLGA